MRSPGLHLTDITKDMLATSGIVRGSGKKFSPEEQKMIFEHGFLWERIIEAHLNYVELEKGILVRPGEFMMDGVACTPDAINLASWHLEEWKSTAIRSWNLDIQSSKPEWLWQAMAYCRYFGMTRAVFRVWNWGEMPCKVTQTAIDFTPTEIEQNWTRILGHARYRGWLQ